MKSRRRLLALLVIASASLGGCTLPSLITTGDHHSCARLRSGAVSCWGQSTSGELGYGNKLTIGDNETPASAGTVPLGVNALGVSAGNAHTCAVTVASNVRCWGSGSLGRLGYGNSNDIGDGEPPSAAGDVPLGATATSVAAGGEFTCALVEGGRVRCWGFGGWGALGHGNISDIGDNETPASAGDVPLGGTATQIVAGAFHACALLDSGGVRCWGTGAAGALGYPGRQVVGATNTPADVGDVPLGAPATQLAAGYAHTCALLATGAVRCWGLGDEGRLGYGNNDDVTSAARATDISLGGTATQITAGTFHTCAVLAGGAVRCWGRGSDGQLGYGNGDSIGDNELPSSVGPVDVGGPVTAIAAGGEHTCAVVDDTSYHCWGKGMSGALGYGNGNSIGDNETPASAGNVAVP
jgi:alpha-tubulin suppressor-like RCC1 family protein